MLSLTYRISALKGQVPAIPYYLLAFGYATRWIFARIARDLLVKLCLPSMNPCGAVKKHAILSQVLYFLMISGAGVYGDIFRQALDK